MKRNGLINKRILGVCGRTDILQTLEDKIKDGCPKCWFDKVTTAEEACRLMMLFSYHLLVVDETNLKKFPRSESSSIQNFPLVVLTGNGKLPVDQENSFAPNIYGYLPANRLEKTIPIISRLLSIEFVPRWQSPFKRYGGIFNLGTVEATDKLLKNGLMKAPCNHLQEINPYKVRKTRPSVEDKAEKETKFRLSPWIASLGGSLRATFISSQEH